MMSKLEVEPAYARMVRIREFQIFISLTPKIVKNHPYQTEKSRNGKPAKNGAASGSRTHMGVTPKVFEMQ